MNWLSVKDTLFLNDAVLVHKCLHGEVPAYLADKFMPRSAIHKRSTRHCNDLDLPKRRLATGQRMFSDGGAKLYNGLPGKLRTLRTQEFLRKHEMNS